ncbi:MAG: AAA family ATPase, partial [Treponema sp.]|nr:AAA family ATPase [Treponema sp.]
RELFQAIAGRPALAIAGLEKEWRPYPVLHLDLTGTSYQGVENLDSRLASNLRMYEETWGADAADSTADARFFGLIRRACRQANSPVVVLIDEYDKPLTDTLGKPELHREMRERLQGFYSVLKAADQWLRFVFLTGVTKFSKVSIFSTLNQLRDISMSAQFAGLCGISEPELAANFGPEIEALAEKKKRPAAEIVREMRKRYNGYHFSKGENSPVSDGMYTPFSVLNTFANRDFSYYWYQTGTPAFLVELLKQTDFDPRQLNGGIRIEPQTIEATGRRIPTRRPSSTSPGTSLSRITTSVTMNTPWASPTRK